VSGIFPNIWCHNSDQIEFPALTLLLWDLSCFTRTPDLKKGHSLTSSQDSSYTLVRLQLPSTTSQSSLKVLSPLESPPRTLSCGLSLSLISSKTLALGHSLLCLWELGSPLGTMDPPIVKTFLLGIVLHISLSLLRT
jgi:hypothetical protein